LKKDKGYSSTNFTVIIELIQSFVYLWLQLSNIYVNSGQLLHLVG